MSATQFVKLCECGCGQPTFIPKHSRHPSRMLTGHYVRVKRPVAERLMEKVWKTAYCWEWHGAIDTDGYGNFAERDGCTKRAHRAVYELLVGPIPDGLTLDHQCNNRRCVNPAHLVPATHGDNLRRSNCVSAVNARKTHCIHGHEFTPENTYITTNGRGRHCRTCSRILDKQRWRRKAAQNKVARGA